MSIIQNAIDSIQIGVEDFESDDEVIPPINKNTYK